MVPSEKKSEAAALSGRLLDSSFLMASACTTPSSVTTSMPAAQQAVTQQHCRSGGAEDTDIVKHMCQHSEAWVRAPLESKLAQCIGWHDTMKPQHDLCVPTACKFNTSCQERVVHVQELCRSLQAAWQVHETWCKAASMLECAEATTCCLSSSRTASSAKLQRVFTSSTVSMRGAMSSMHLQRHPPQLWATHSSSLLTSK